MPLHHTLRLVVLVALPLLPIAAQSSPTIAPLLGEWKADLPRSTNAPTLLESMTLTFSQRGDTMVLVQRATRPGSPAQLTTTRMLPNGAPVENVMGPDDKQFTVRTTARWDGKRLEIASAGQVQGLEFTNSREYRLEKGGKELASSTSTLIGGMRNVNEIRFVQAAAAGATRSGER